LKGFKNLSIKEVTSVKLAEISRALGKSQAQIIGEYIDILKALLQSNFNRDCVLSYVILPMYGKAEIHMTDRQLWRLEKLQKGMKREEIENLEKKLKKGLKGD
jgi:hypothetical protein